MNNLCLVTRNHVKIQEFAVIITNLRIMCVLVQIILLAKIVNIIFIAVRIRVKMGEHVWMREILVIMNAVVRNWIS